MSWIKHKANWIISMLPILYYLCILTDVAVKGANDLWPLDRPDGMPSIQSLEVMCGKDHMDVHLTFSQPFEGIVSSKGQHGDPRCVYVPPSTGQTFFSFRIAYARCGTKPDLHGQFYENTVVVQYDKDLLEVWDEAKRLRCEWFNDYEKTASKPPMVIADLDVIQLDFRGDNVDCWMEIQHGKGPWAPPVSGIVPLGSTLTLVVAINDYKGEFDMRVKSCMASDGGGHVIQLSDEFGCVLRPKMISQFLKARKLDERATVITYAFFHAFKFPDALSVHIKCKVEICRHGCLDHCQLHVEKSDNDPSATDNNHPEMVQYIGPLDRHDDNIGDVIQSDDNSKRINAQNTVVYYENHADDEQIIADGTEISGTNGNNLPAVNLPLNNEHQQSAVDSNQQLQFTNVQNKLSQDEELDVTAVPHKFQDIFLYPQREPFPHGPRQFDHILEPSPRMLQHSEDEGIDHSNKRKSPKRKRRSAMVLDRKARSADVGVSGLYDVISEADLAFSPDNRVEAVTVFQGRIREEVVYGICMPVPGFSALFVLVAMSAVASALVAGFLLYRYQMQKEQLAQQQTTTEPIPMNLLTGWMGMRLMKVFASSQPPPVAANQPSTSRNNGLLLENRTALCHQDSDNMKSDAICTCD